MSKKTKQKVHFARMRNSYQKAAKSVPAVKDVTNKVWVLTVVATLWSSAYVIYMCSVSGVPLNLKQILSGALFVLGLMYLFANLRSTKPSASVLE